MSQFWKKKNTTMQRTAFILLVSVIASSSSVSAQPSNVPAIDIDCNDFAKQGPDTWFANGNVHLKINGQDIALNNATIKPGAKTSTGVDLYALLDNMCGGH